LAATFKKCKLFDKTFSKANQQVKSKFKDFLKWKEQNPLEKFGSSDYPFSGAGNLQGYWHAKLTFDVSIIYRQEKGVIYLYGVFSHDDIGTGQPSNITKQKQTKVKLDGQVFT
jgi:mRNA-degrading endonuclease YafQ of YafQ-DinJ toxin-antitoxin module